jgi:hypothetical protein
MWGLEGHVNTDDLPRTALLYWCRDLLLLLRNSTHFLESFSSLKQPITNNLWYYTTNTLIKMEVPTKTSLADIYPEDALQAQTARWNNLLSTFKDTYGKSADFVSRSPGRVNIIGEVSRTSAKPLLRARLTMQ